MRILLLTPEAFGGHGGIAQYNRDLLVALCELPEIEEVVAIPRSILHPLENLPPKLDYRRGAAAGKTHFVRAVLQACRERFDLVICGHINLLPLAWLCSARSRSPLALLAYGIEVWRAHASSWVRWSLRGVDAVWSISAITGERFRAWSNIAAGRVDLLPNAIALENYGMAAKESSLVERYGLGESKVLLLLARLASSERYKGIDELLEILPDLLEHEQNLIFMVAGDGDDRFRMEAKAQALGISKHVVFTGLVPESEKHAHFCLADAFAMPGRGEGFGFVFLEAMASGIPVVASSLDGSREAVRFGLLGQMVDPDDRAALKAAIIRALHSEKRIPEGLEYFSFANFRSRLQALLSSAGKL